MLPEYGYQVHGPEELAIYELLSYMPYLHKQQIRTYLEPIKAKTLIRILDKMEIQKVIRKAHGYFYCLDDKEPFCQMMIDAFWIYLHFTQANGKLKFVPITPMKELIFINNMIAYKIVMVEGNGDLELGLLKEKIEADKKQGINTETRYIIGYYGRENRPKLSMLPEAKTMLAEIEPTDKPEPNIIYESVERELCG